MYNHITRREIIILKNIIGSTTSCLPPPKKTPLIFISNSFYAVILLVFWNGTIISHFLFSQVFFLTYDITYLCFRNLFVCSLLVGWILKHYKVFLGYASFSLSDVLGYSWEISIIPMLSGPGCWCRVKDCSS